MNRIELYIDRNDRLTLDFFYKHTSDMPIARYKGKECYSVISELCKGNIIEFHEDEKKDEIILIYKETVIRINEYSKTFGKRGTGPLKQNIYDYYVKQETTKKLNKTKPKVVRKNKHLGKEIIAGALALVVLGGIICHEIANKNKKNSNPEAPTKPSISYTYEEELPIVAINDTNSKTSDLISLDFVNFSDIDHSKVITVNLDYNDRSNTEKARITKAYYGDTIEKYAKMYGLNPQIVIAIATQERGIHSEKKDSGGATGLMQIQNAVWSGEKLKAFNYDTNSYETIVVDEEKLSDVFYNIKVGCMYFQNCMNYMDGNVLAAIQCYNMGYGNMQSILASYSLESNKTIEEILSDQADFGWLNHRDIIKVGDQKYIEHVLSWISGEIELDNIKSNNETVTLKLNNKIDTKSMSYN